MADGLSQLRGGRLAKVILSRAVDLVGPVNMPQTLLTGLKSNTPRTTFCLSHGGFQATGFSPELVMSLENGRVTTEPLAGTHSCGCSDAERLKCDKNFSVTPRRLWNTFCPSRPRSRNLSRFARTIPSLSMTSCQSGSAARCSILGPGCADS